MGCNMSIALKIDNSYLVVNEEFMLSLK